MERKRTASRFQCLNPTFRIWLNRRLHLLVQMNHPFGQEALAQLRALNAKFCEIEALCLREASRMAGELRARVQDPDDAFTDFEIEAKITACLRKEDPAWDEDADNILAWREYWLTHSGGLFCDGADWSFENDSRIRGMGPVCWMFHDFHIHSHKTMRVQGKELAPVSPMDLLRIGRIWVDINAIHQWDLNLLPGRPRIGVRPDPADSLTVFGRSNSLEVIMRETANHSPSTPEVRRIPM